MQTTHKTRIEKKDNRNPNFIWSLKWHCGNCLAEVKPEDRYCRLCGRRFVQEDRTRGQKEGL